MVAFFKAFGVFFSSGDSFCQDIVRVGIGIYMCVYVGVRELVTLFVKVGDLSEKFLQLSRHLFVLFCLT